MRIMAGWPVSPELAEGRASGRTAATEVVNAARRGRPPACSELAELLRGGAYRLIMGCTLPRSHILAGKPRRKWAAGSPRSGAHPYRCARSPARSAEHVHHQKGKRWSVQSRTPSGSRASAGSISKLLLSSKKVSPTLKISHHILVVSFASYLAPIPLKTPPIYPEIL